MTDAGRTRVAHGAVGPISRTIEVACLLAAGGLLAADIVRLATTIGFRWWIPILIAAAGLVADLVSGLVHWGADTWGRDTLPVLGPRFLRPFRVHHVNPGDFLQRSFVDCNGDVAMLTIPVLAAVWWMPLEVAWGPAAAVFLTAFAFWTLPTNQVHQWAHMPEPPRPVRWLQAAGIILSPGAHERHHVSPYAMNYCIATGWCNRVLTRLHVFSRLERAITRITGQRPRMDDAIYAAEGEAATGSHVRGL
jgi:ubiquitin-conjugating enzyme E2 variant